MYIIICEAIFTIIYYKLDIVYFIIAEEIAKKTLGYSFTIVYIC